MSSERLPLAKRVGFSLALLVLLLVALEAGARFIYAVRAPLLVALGRSPRNMALSPYKIPDPRHPGFWMHRPDFSMTFAEVIDYKRSLGRFVGLESLETTAARYGIRPDDVVFTINHEGFKGPPLDPSHARPRIVALGDSCTAGTQIDRFTYSRSLERELASRGVPAEVVNGGVEGYEPVDILTRIDDFTALRPEWTILYIGWNALSDEKEGRGFLERHWVTQRLARRLLVALGPKHTLRETALEAFTKPKHPVPDAPEVRARDDYVPTFFGDVPKIVDAMQASGSRVVLVTLPGLYTTREPPSPEALAEGHLPAYTDNPYVLAHMTERYNELLRGLAAERGLPVIDLERWADDALRPRHAWFVDSVHLTEEGQQRIGIFMAEQLAPLVGAQVQARASRDRSAMQ